MQLPSYFVAGFEALDDPAASPWLEGAHALVAPFTADVHGEEGARDCCQDCGFHPVNSIAVHLAACEIWRDSGGEPGWSKLDVVALADKIAGSPLATMAEELMVTLHAFYSFLWLHGHVDPHEVDHILGALDGYTSSLAERLGLRLPPSRWGSN